MLKIEIFKSLLFIVMLTITLQFSALIVAVGAMISSYVIALLYLIYARKIIQISLKKVLILNMRNILYSIVIYVVYVIYLLGNYKSLLIAVFMLILSFALYIFIAWLAGDDNMKFLRKIIKELK